MRISKFMTVYTISVFVILAALDNMIIGLFPPLFSCISSDLGVEISFLGFASGANILFTVISSVYWGYISGKYNRKLLVIIGTIIWSLSVYITSKSNSFGQLFFMQIITGIGLGCISSVGFSILTDYIPKKYRGMLLSLWGMSQGLGGILGSLFASLIAPSKSWRTPFEILSILGLLLIVLYIFTKEPSYGQSEPELKKLINSGRKYVYNIEIKHIKTIIFNRSNKYLFFQAFFINITIGTFIWLPTLYNSKILKLGYDGKTAIVISGYLYAIFQIGGVFSPCFGYIGDYFNRKYKISRAKITSYFVFLMIPFYSIMFLSPLKNFNIKFSDNSLTLCLSLFKQIVINPWMFGIFIFAILASATQSANTPNWLALITEANLPEHRGTAFSLANLANGIGRTIGTAGIGVLITVMSLKFNEPENYSYALVAFQIFLIPSGILYYIMSKFSERDVDYVKKILKERGKV
ncbi:MAG: MFS transporter [Clostridiales bacterium]